MSRPSMPEARPSPPPYQTDGRAHGSPPSRADAWSFDEERTDEMSAEEIAVLQAEAKLDAAGGAS